MFDKSELNQLFRYCFVLVDNEADAYDLLQNSLEKCLRSPPADTNAKLAYMRTIIRNRFIDDYRSKQRYTFSEFDEENITSITDSLENFDHEIDNKDQATKIWKLLDASEKEIMYMWAILGYSTSEVAERLNTPKGTIVSKLSRLRNRIKTNLSLQEKMSVA